MVAVDRPGVDRPGDESGAGRARPSIGVAAALALVVLIAFAPALGNDWVRWDDDTNFLDNYHYRGLGWFQVRFAFATSILGAYQPLAWLILGAEYLTWGMDPWGYHLTSLLFHLVNAIALYALTFAILARCRPVAPGEDALRLSIASGLATALFAVHPLRAEAVAWVSCQPYLPCAFFCLLASMAYLRAHPAEGPTRPAWVVGSLALFALAMLCKAAAVGLPAALVVLDAYPLRRLGGSARDRRWALLEKLPFVALSALFVVLALKARAQDRSAIPTGQKGLAAQVARACYNVVFYPWKTLCPTGLMAYYPTPTRWDWSGPGTWAYLAVVVGVTAALLAIRKRWPGPLAAWAAYLALLAPSSGFLWRGIQLYADRYSYLPTMSFAVLAAAGFDRIARTSRHANRAGWTGLGVVLALTVLTWVQVGTWRDTESLWSHALAWGGDRSAMICGFAGGEMIRQDRYREARGFAERALRIDPENSQGHGLMGMALQGLGRRGEAIAQFEEALRLHPDDARVHSALGIALCETGRFDEAIAHYRRAVDVDPHFAEAYSNWGAALFVQGHLDEAIPLLRMAVRVKPDLSQAQYTLGRALYRQGRLDEAIVHLEAAQELRPDDPQIRLGLEEVLADPRRSARPGSAP